MRNRLSLLSLGQCISWGVLFYALPVALPVLEAELHASRAAVTGAFSVALLAAALGAIPVARLVGNGHARAVMTGGSAAAALLVAGAGFATSLPAFYAVLAGLGVTMAATLYEPAFVVVTIWYPDVRERVRALSLVTVVGGFAGAVFVPLTHRLLTTFPRGPAFAILGAFLLLTTAPIHAAVLRERGSVAAPVAAGHPAIPGRVLTLFAGMAFLATLAAIGISVHAVPLVTSRGLTTGDAVHALAALSLAQVPARLLFPAFHGRIGAAGWGAISLLLEAAGAATLALASTSSLALAGASLFGLGTGLSTLARATAASEVGGAAGQAFVAGRLGAASSLARAAAPYLVSVLAASVGYGGFVALLVGALLLGATAMAMALAPGSLAWNPGPIRSRKT